MIVAGVVVGALASAFGYSFFILAIILFAQLMYLRRRRLLLAESDQRIAKKFIAPSVAFLIAATIGSYVFSVEGCDRNHTCHRMFFDRIYTPPHLVSPPRPAGLR